MKSDERVLVPYPGIQEVEFVGCVGTIVSFNLINIFFVGFNLKSDSLGKKNFRNCRSF